MHTAEHLPWCQKIDESKKPIAELKDYIDDVKAADETPSEAPAASAEDFADAQPEQEQTASEEAPCACTETPCCSEQAAPEAPKKKEGCYIATAVYGSYDAPEVRTLRRFRDETLKKSAAGRMFIRVYYRFSPPIAQRLKNATKVNRLVRRMLDGFVEKLNEKKS